MQTILHGNVTFLYCKEEEGMSTCMGNFGMLSKLVVFPGHGWGVHFVKGLAVNKHQLLYEKVEKMFQVLTVCTSLTPLQ